MKNCIVKYLVVVTLASISLIPVMAAGESFWTSPDTIPPWVSRWAVTNVTPFTATINWSTDEPSDAMVEFCTSWTHCNNFTPLVPEFTVDHSINLSGLAPATRYYFYMYSRDQFGNTRVYGYRTFTTAWVPLVITPTPLPTPVLTPTPYPTPYPSQTPIPGPDVTAPWPTKWSVNNITPFAATVNWSTNEPSDSRLEFCTTWMHCGNFTPLVSALSTEHQINLSGLSPYTRYYFYMYSRDASGNELVYGYRTFTTAWIQPVISPTPLPTPVLTSTPTRTPYPSQAPIAGPDVTPPWVVRWTVSDITDSSARVEWITDEASDGMVEICPSWSHCAVFTPRTNNNSTNHGTNLTGLSASKRYYFWMYSRDDAGNLRVYGYKTFYTAWQ
ncbi:MAG: hypothetical protein Q7S43_01650 [bacterium]|nr:hypothetical protein [bacterium]